MTEQHHLRDMQRYVANVGITASALRGLEGGGYVRTARAFLGELDLNSLAAYQPSEYLEWLNEQTQALQVKFPEHFWGPARKSINIFMTMASLNRFLCEDYALGRLEYVLEVPLDSIVVSKLTIFARGEDLPKWTSIKALYPTNSAKYQQVAEKMAKELGIPRGRLDVALWEPNGSQKSP